MNSTWRDPVWPEEIDLQTDLSPSEWILPRLLPWGRDGTPVTSVVPSGYPAYVRVLHPAFSRYEYMTWKEISSWSGRIYHPLMQFQRISIPVGDTTSPAPFVRAPGTGDLTDPECATLFSALGDWTTTPHVCWLGIWAGWGSLGYPRSISLQRIGNLSEPQNQEAVSLEQQLAEVAERANSAPRFEHPGRSYLLAISPTSAIFELSRPPLGITPSLVWPDDRAWCVTTEIDFDSTLVGCSEECAAALVANDRLEALLVPPDGRLDIGGDELNPPSEGAP